MCRKPTVVMVLVLLLGLQLSNVEHEGMARHRSVITLIKLFVLAGASGYEIVLRTHQTLDAASY